MKLRLSLVASLKSWFYELALLHVREGEKIIFRNDVKNTIWKKEGESQRRSD